MERSSLRLVGPMHIAETREKAIENVQFGLQKWVDYFSTINPMAAGDDMSGDPIEGMLESGRAVIGTPDDAIAMIERLEKAGFTCETLCFGEVTNLWAKRGRHKPILCFAGHTDVVPPGSAKEWHSDPFEPQLRDGNLYGRGSADMKSGLAAMIIAVENFLPSRLSVRYAGVWNRVSSLRLSESFPPRARSASAVVASREAHASFTSTCPTGWSWLAQAR